jgi:purine nucleosidase
MTKQLVLMDHDGGVDDYLATMLLLTMDHIELLGVVVTPADCYIQPAVSATRKIIDLMGFSHIPKIDVKLTLPIYFSNVSNKFLVFDLF